jgi:hypothetical protein
LALCGCGSTTKSSGTDAGAGGLEPTIARALAYVAAEHAGAPLAGCTTTEDGVLMWEEQTPEDDPGVVYVLVDKGGSAVDAGAGLSFWQDVSD